MQRSREEECDDGSHNDAATSTCDSDCKVRDVCGNGTVEDTEECDDGNDNEDDECSNECTHLYCGDGIVQSGRGEECDDFSDDRCDSDCKRIDITGGIGVPPTIGGGGGYCGDGNIDSDLGEECDEAAANGSMACTSDCRRPDTSNRRKTLRTSNYSTNSKGETTSSSEYKPPLSRSAKLLR